MRTFLVFTVFLCGTLCDGYGQEPPPPLFMGNERLMEMVRARIFSRKGLYEQSLKLYRQLRRKYPADEDIWEDYTETLVNHRDYTLALTEVGRLLKKNPSNLRGQRILARVYTEMKDFPWAFPVYENILRLYPGDAGIWSDYAHARRESGDWSAALNYFCRVLEPDPQNKNALKAVHTILRERRPRLETAYAASQPEHDSRIRTASLGHSCQIGPRTRMTVGYDTIRISRSDGPDRAGFNETIDDIGVGISHDFGKSWQVRLGAGTWDGPVRQTSLMAGLSYRGGDRTHLRGEYVQKRPWYDPVEAANHEGYFDKTGLSLDWTPDDQWGLHLETAAWAYYADGGRQYGDRRTFTGILTRRLASRPDLYLGYSFYRSCFSYADEAVRPISMLTSQGIHTLFGHCGHWPCAAWGYDLSAGVSRDGARSVNAWYAIPGIQVKLGNRIRCRVNYEYASASATTADEETRTVRLSLSIIF